MTTGSSTARSRAGSSRPGEKLESWGESTTSVVAQRVIPMVAYEDPAAAIEFLSSAFGFEEDPAERYTEPDGRITHAQLSLGDATIMLANPTPEYLSPKSHREECERAARMYDNPGSSTGTSLRRRRGRALRAGAGSRRDHPARARGSRHWPSAVLGGGLEGHRWMFSD